MNKLPSIIYAMGNKKISYYCLNELVKSNIHPKLLIFPKKNLKYINKVKKEFDIPYIYNINNNLNLIKNINADYLISIHYPKIFKGSIFDYIRKDIINLHPSYLPYNRGWHPCSWSIIDNTPIGVTMHIVDKEIDTGEICFQKKIFVKPNYTADIIYNKLIYLEKELFKESIPFIIKGNLPRITQNNELSTFHKKKDLQKIREINLNEENIKLINKLKALTTNNINEAAYFIVNNKKYLININIFEEK